VGRSVAGSPRCWTGGRGVPGLRCLPPSRWGRPRLAETFPCTGGGTRADALSAYPAVDACPHGRRSASRRHPVLPIVCATQYCGRHGRRVQRSPAGAASRHDRAGVPEVAAHPRVRVRPAPGTGTPRLHDRCEHAVPAAAATPEAGLPHQRVEHRRGPASQVLPDLTRRGASGRSAGTGMAGAQRLDHAAHERIARRGDAGIRPGNSGTRQRNPGTRPGNACTRYCRGASLHAGRSDT